MFVVNVDAYKLNAVSKPPTIVTFRQPRTRQQKINKKINQKCYLLKKNLNNTLTKFMDKSTGDRTLLRREIN